MKKLVAVTTSTARSVFLDPASVCGMLFYPADNLTVIYSADGELVRLACPQGRADLENIAEQLNAAGTVVLPLADEKCLVYAAPAAICYVATNTHGAVLVGIQGMGAYETLDGKAWQTLFAAVKNAGNTVLSYTPDVAHSRFYEPAALHIVPAHITSMCGDGSVEQLNVTFSHCGELDVQIGNETVRSALFTMIANKYWHELREEFADLNAVYDVARKDVEDFTASARRELAASLAGATGAGLTQIQNSQRPIYVQLQHFNHVLTFNPEKEGGKYQLSLRGKKEAGSFGGAVTANFNSAAERDASLDALKHILTKTPPGAEPKPPAR